MNNKGNIESNIIEEFSLPKYIKGKTFAEASEAIDNKFKDRKDQYATQTKEELLERLAEAQEYVKMQEEAAEAEAMGIDPSMQEGMAEEGMQDMQGMDPGMEQAMDPGMEGMEGMVEEGAQQAPDLSAMLGEQMARGGYARKQMAGGGFPEIEGGGNVWGEDDGKTLRSDAATGKVSGVGAAGSAIGGMGSAIGGASDLLNMGMDAGRTRETDNSITEYSDSVNVGAQTGQAALKGAAAGAAIGSVIPGVGTLIGGAAGAVVGGVSGFIGGKKDKKSAMSANTNLAYRRNDQYDNDFAKGGYIDRNPVHRQMWDGGKTKKTSDTSRPYGDFIDYKGIDKAFKKPQLTDTASAYGADYLNTNLYKDKVTGTNPGGKVDWNKYGNLAIDAMPLVPAVGGMFNKIKRSETPLAQTSDVRYRHTNIDRGTLENSVSQNNIQGALTEASGGNQGALMANLQGANLNKMKAYGAAEAQATQAEAADRMKGQEFNAATDRFNISQNERYIERKGQDEAAYNNAKAGQRKATLESIGNYGKELQDKRMVAKMYGYKWNGDYLVDKNGEKVSKEEENKFFSKLFKGKEKNK